MLRSDICYNMSDYWRHLQSYSRKYTTASRPTGLDGIVVNIDRYFALYTIKHIIMTKHIWCVNDTSNCGQAFVTLGLIINVIYIPTPGPKRRHLGLLAWMVLQFSLKVTMLHNC